MRGSPVPERLRPDLQVGGQVVRFLTEHLGNPIPSPALFEKIGNRFRREVKAYASTTTAQEHAWGKPQLETCHNVQVSTPKKKN